MTRRRVAVGIALAAAAAIGLATVSCHGHTLQPEYVPNHPGETFDFKKPPCEVGGRPDASEDEVLIRYIGVSGLYVSWRGSALLTAPFMTNYSPYHTAFKTIAWDLDAIHDGMAGLPDVPIEVVLAGHSHHDHLGDLPPIVEHYAPTAEVWVNRSGANMLANCAELSEATPVELEPLAGTWRRPESADGTPLPFRVMVLEANHAEHFLNVDLADGDVEEPWDDCLPGHKVRHMLAGRTFGFLIDLLDDDGSTRFRIHHQDAASDAPLGIPDGPTLEERPIDLAMVCLPDAWEVDDYPGALLRAADVRHVLVSHYEDFFRARKRPLRFVSLLTEGRADRFMRSVAEEMTREDRETRGPDNQICGPSGDAWTMPLPGEWLLFR